MAKLVLQDQAVMILPQERNSLCWISIMSR